MKTCYITWLTTYVAGVFIQIDAQERAAGSNASTTSDYDQSYSDYNNRDYPNLDYYSDDAREGRGFKNDYANPSDDENEAHHHQENDFMLQQLKSTIPGVPGIDYGLYQSVPDTSFLCREQRNPGFYGDVDAQCQVFHICQEDDRQDSFLCPVGTVFNQINFVCDWWFNFRCEDTPMHYHLNNQLHSQMRSASMKDTINKMHEIQKKKTMKMSMELKKAAKNARHSIGKEKRSDKVPMSPKVINLFRLGMRRSRSGHFQIKENLGEPKMLLNQANFTDHVKSPRRAAVEDDFVKSVDSTGFGGVSVNDYFTTLNPTSPNDQLVKTSAPEFGKYLTTNFSFQNGQQRGINSATSFESLLNITDFETSINESINMTAGKTDVYGTETNTNTAGQYLKMTTEFSTSTDESKIENTVDAKGKNILEKLHLNDDSVDSEPKTAVNDVYTQNQSILHDDRSFHLSYVNAGTFFSNAANQALDLPSSERQITDLQSPKSPYTIEDALNITSTTPPTFKHQNSFIIGNDTHISVSVTIHSQSGRSRLQWKRLPGVKRVRKIRIRNQEDNSSYRENSINETIYRKRMFAEKPRSRVMWTPAKKNSLERRFDLKTLIQPKMFDAVAEIKIMPVEHYPQKAALSINKLPDTNRKHSHQIEKDVIEFEKKDNLSNSTVSLKANVSTTYATENIKNNSSLINVTEESSIVKKMSIVMPIVYSKIEKRIFRPQNYNDSTSNKCKTLCIKLLESKNKSFSNEKINSTKFFDYSDPLTLLDYKIVESNLTPTFYRKGLLRVAPSEQLSVKHDPGPNCDDNSGNNKVLVKGWSVIVDKGLLTKEKTVKRRGCKKNPKDGRRNLMRKFKVNPSSNQNNIRFNSKGSNNPPASKLDGESMDQRYWLNLVKNWLENSPSPETKGHRRKQMKPFSNPNDVTDTFRTPKFGGSESRILENSYLNKQSQQEMNIPSVEIPKYDWLSDLQAERSDWSQTTERSSDRSNANMPRKYSFRGEIKKWELGLSNENDRNFSHETRRSNRDLNFNKGSAVVQMDSSSNGDDASPPNYEDDIGSWGQSFKDYDSDSFSSMQKWSQNFQKGQENKVTFGMRNKDFDQGTNYESTNQKGSDTVNESKKGPWLNRDEDAKEWSFKAFANRQDQRRTDISNFPKESWENAGSSRDVSDKSADKDNARRSGSGPTKNNKGRSMRDEWNWSDNKGFDGNIGPSRNSDNWSKDTKDSTSRRNAKGITQNHGSNRRQNRNSMTPHRSFDKGNPRSNDDWMPQRPQMSKSNKGSSYRDRTSEETSDWRDDSSSVWDNRKRMNNDRRTGGTDNKGISFGDDDFWRSDDQNDWSSDEESNYRSTKNDWVDEDMNNKNIWPSKAPDDNSRYEPDQNKRFRPNSQRSSQNQPEWKSKENSGWPKPADDRMSFDRPTLSRRRNQKGDVYLGSRGMNTGSSHQSWNANPQNNWPKDKTKTTKNFGKNSRQSKGGSDSSNPNRNNKNRNFSTGKNWQSDSNQQPDNSDVSSWDSSEESFENPPQTDEHWDVKSKMDFEPSYNSQRDPTTFSKGSRKGGNRNPPSGNGKKQSPSPSSDIPWSSGKPCNSGSKGCDKSSPKPDSQSRGDSWRSRKAENMDKRNPKLAPPMKGSPKIMSKDTWENNGSIVRNASNNKGDSSMKKIIWSAQISSDGKLGNGWVPITLRPNIKLNVSRNNSSNKRDDEDWPTTDKESSWAEEDWPTINKGSPISKDWPSVNEGKVTSEENWPPTNEEISSSEEDWTSTGKRRSASDEDWLDEKNPVGDEKWSSSNEETLLDEDWTLSNKDSMKKNEGILSENDESKNRKSKLFQQNDTTQTDDIVTEIYSSTPLLSDASLKHRFYIPGMSHRDKRSYKIINSEPKPNGTQNSGKKSYKIIRSGEIFSDILNIDNNNNNFFLAKAGITVGNSHGSKKNGSYIHYRMKNLLDQEYNNQSLQNTMLQKNFSNINFTSARKHDYAKILKGFDILPKESIVSQRWSTPFYNSNFSTSGWIPVNAQRWPSIPNNDRLRAFRSRDSDTFETPNTNNPLMGNPNINTKFDNNSRLKNKTLEPFKIFEQDEEGKIDEIYKNGSSNERFKAESNDMKIGNKTLRIISFSEVMKRFSQDNNSDDAASREIAWSIPLTTAPKMYSLKPVNLSMNGKDNIGSAWIFSSENGTKQAWILTEKSNDPISNKINSSLLPKKVQNKSEHDSVMLIGSETTNSFPKSKNVLSNRTESSQDVIKASFKDEFRVKFDTLNKDSEWKPVVTGIGKVIPFNRTYIPIKGLTTK